MFVWLIVGNQERRVQYKTRLSKEDLGRGEIIQRNNQDHWEMESGKGLLAIQYAGFQLG